MDKAKNSFKIRRYSVVSFLWKNNLKQTGFHMTKAIDYHWHRKNICECKFSIKTWQCTWQAGKKLILKQVKITGQPAQKISVEN